MNIIDVTIPKKPFISLPRLGSLAMILFFNACSGDQYIIIETKWPLFHKVFESSNISWAPFRKGTFCQLTCKMQGSGDTILWELRRSARGAGKRDPREGEWALCGASWGPQKGGVDLQLRDHWRLSAGGHPQNESQKMGSLERGRAAVTGSAAGECHKQDSEMGHEQLTVNTGLSVLGVFTF